MQLVKLRLVTQSFSEVIRKWPGQFARGRATGETKSQLGFDWGDKAGTLSTRTTRTSRATGETVSHYRNLDLEWSCINEEGVSSTGTTRTSRKTDETVSHYRNLEFQCSYKKVVKSGNSYDSYDVRVMQLVKLHVVAITNQ